MSILKRQRERKKAEKAARKRARRHGLEEDQAEPRPTVGLADLIGGTSSGDVDAEAEGDSDEPK